MMTPSDPLTLLAMTHGADKWDPHCYTPIYHALFAPLRDQPLRILEIGVGGYADEKAGGCSLRMWSDYFPQATIVGLDIIEKKLTLGRRITIRQGSQTDTAVLQSLNDEFGPFDIVIDDGSHNPADFFQTLRFLLPLVKPTGFYIIEDIGTSFYPGFGGTPEGGLTSAILVNLFRQLHHEEILNVTPDWQPSNVAKQIKAVRLYHDLLVIEKGPNERHLRHKPPRMTSECQWGNRP